MAKKPVQFWLGMSQMAFLDRYGSEEECRDPSARAGFAIIATCHQNAGQIIPKTHLPRRSVYVARRSGRGRP